MNFYFINCSSSYRIDL
ncbi:hypothetical protein ACO2JP_09315 [Leptospira kirschneri]